jgi:hypothetical protein
MACHRAERALNVRVRVEPRSEARLEICPSVTTSTATGAPSTSTFALASTRRNESSELRT